MTSEEKPFSFAKLRQLVADLRAENERIRGDSELLRQENTQLRARVEKVRQARRSELYNAVYAAAFVREYYEAKRVLGPQIKISIARVREAAEELAQLEQESREAEELTELEQERSDLDKATEAHEEALELVELHRQVRAQAQKK